MNRSVPRQLVDRWLRFVLLLTVSWVVMTFTHELGHVIGGWLGGANLTRLELRPWRLPYSLFQPDPCPLLTLWAGPIFGIGLPGLVAVLAQNHSTWFVASFCSLANGSYLAIAWISGEHHLDTPRLLQAGAWPASIAMYCAITIGWGYVAFRRACIDTLRPE